MLQFLVRELLVAKEREEGRQISLREVASATGISPQVLSSLASPQPRPVVTNTAFVEALCRYFACTPNELMQLNDNGNGERNVCHVDELYPERRRRE